MNDLDEIQAFISAQLQSRKALPKDHALSASAASMIRKQGRLTPAERLEIYREQFWLRHTSSLVEDFPGLSGVLGQAAWASLVEGYLEAHPPRSYTLRDLGAQLPEYVAKQAALPNHGLCRDMARLEWAYIEIFDAADSLPITAQALAAIPENAWQAAQIVLQPALRLLELDYPVAPLRRALIEARESGVEVALPERREHCLLLFRRDLQMFHEPVSRGAHALLTALTQRIPLVAACQQAQAAVPGEARAIEENLALWFQSWSARGFVSGVLV